MISCVNLIFVVVVNVGLFIQWIMWIFFNFLYFFLYEIKMNKKEQQNMEKRGKSKEKALVESILSFNSAQKNLH